MITKETYTIEYVNTLREKYKKDPSLLERVLFAFAPCGVVVANFATTSDYS